MTRFVYCTFNKAVVTDETTALLWTVVLHLMYCSINFHCTQWQSRNGTHLLSVLIRGKLWAWVTFFPSETRELCVVGSNNCCWELPGAGVIPTSLEKKTQKENTGLVTGFYIL